jgi:aspartyl/glutamyl-tRNA(Asn/Gln) amidotransferase C subunit
MEDLQKVDVSNVEPLRNVNDIELLERNDSEFSKNIEQEELLSNAPQKNGNFFTVPKVIE